MEGLHHAWNVKAKGSLQFYKLVELIHDLAKGVELTTTLLSGGNRLRKQNKSTALKNEKLLKFWNKLERFEQERTSFDLFKMVVEIEKIIKPSPKFGPKDFDNTYFDPTTIPPESDSDSE